MSKNIQELQENISKSCGLAVDLVINENRSHLFTVLDRQPFWARLSIHKMFLQAPEKVITALAKYVRGFDKRWLSIISHYIDENIRRPEYTQRLDPTSLYTKGQYFDLEELFKRVQTRYFESSLTLSLTWFKQRRGGRCSRVIFGQYHPVLKLIKINKMLDTPQVPDYFIEFVVFHEMLHHIIPTTISSKGRRSIHSPEFKRKEKLFEHYEKAVAWQKAHRHLFFEGGF